MEGVPPRPPSGTAVTARGRTGPGTARRAVRDGADGGTARERRSAPARGRRRAARHVLAVIAGAGSFTHIRDTAAEHGQGGPMSWAVAVCVDLTCVMAARERQRDKQQGVVTQRLSWPTAVLAGGILLSLAANLAQAQPTAWGRIVAAVPPA